MSRFLSSTLKRDLRRTRSFIHPPFLNMMSLIAERAGRVHVRVGGNTQDFARMVPSLADGKAIEKQVVNTNNPVSLLPL